jgi:hypothetical protein
MKVMSIIELPLYLGAEITCVPANGWDSCQARKGSGHVCGITAIVVRKVNEKDVPLCKTHEAVYQRGNLSVYGDVPPVTDQPIVDEDVYEDNNKEEEKMEENPFIYHFLLERLEDGKIVLPRILTNIPTASEFTRYTESATTNKPSHGLLAMSTGTWQPWLLYKRLVDKGYKFRIMILTNEEIKELSSARIMEFHTRSTFDYANDKHTFFVNIEGAEWGLAPFGLVESDVPKLAKRFAEICRLSEMMIYRENGKFTKRMVMPDGDLKFYDGMNFISKKFALRMTNNISDERRRFRLRGDILRDIRTRLNLRMLDEDGLIKGDAIIVEDLDVDIVFHPENLKRELRTTGWAMCTASNHNPYHTAVWDTQTWINNRTMLPESKQMNDIDGSIKDLHDSFEKGVVPDWLLLGEEAHDDSGVPDYERLSELLDKGYYRWQYHGHDIRALANATFMASNGLVLRMKRELKDWPVLHYRKTWTMMSNAFYAPVVTRQALTEMVGININDRDKYMFHHQHYGLVLSGERFRDTYNLHGGWDEDDSVKVILIKLWSADPARTLAMLESGALDPNCAVPATEENAVYAALLVRSPNGPGEYSIEALNQDTWRDLPWFHFGGHGGPLDEANIPIVNLVTAPDPQPMLLQHVTVRGIPTSLEYTGQPLTADQCLAMIEAQRFNPGIGMICNCLMNWVMTFGPSFPPNMLALLEQMVDTTQQSRDPISFQAVNDEVNNLYKQMVDRVVTESRRVDGLLAIAHPIPRKYAEAMKAHMVEARFTRFNQHYAARVDELEKTIIENSKAMREATPLIAYIRGFRISDATAVWARKFIVKYNQEFRMNGYIWRPQKMEKNPFAAMHFEQMRTKANKDTVARMVAELRAFGGLDTHRRVIALWHEIVKSTKENPRGMMDRLIFQPGHTENVMDLVIEALAWRQSIGDDITFES